MLDRGQEQDWFSAREIIVEAVLAGLGLYLFIVHMFTAQRPFLPPGLFKDRNFVAGVSMVFFTATVMLASSALMAPYLETLAGYPVDTAGWSMAPRGIGTMIGMQLASMLANLDERMIMAVGLLTLGLRAAFDELLDARCSHDADGADAAGAGVRHRLRVQSDDGDGVHHAAGGAAQLRHVAAGAGPQYRPGDGRVRHLAAGARRGRRSHADIAANITPFDRVLQGNDVASRMLDATTPHGAAVLDQMVNHQAQIIAYNSDFRLMSLVVLPPLLLLLVMRRHERPAKPAAAPAGGD